MEGGRGVTLKETMPYFWYTTDSQVLKRYKLFQKALKCVEKNNKKQKQQKKTTQEKERKQKKKKKCLINYFRINASPVLQNLCIW